MRADLMERRLQHLKGVVAPISINLLFAGNLLALAGASHVNSEFWVSSSVKMRKVPERYSED